MYQQLLQVKQLHEQTAANALQRSRRNVQQHIDAVQHAQQQNDNFRDFRIGREQQLFDDLKGEAVAVRRIDEMKQRVALLREQQAGLEQAILAAERELEAAREELAQAEEGYKTATREQEKFVEFNATLAAEEQREQQQREENEVEEMVTSSYGRQPGGANRSDS